MMKHIEFKRKNYRFLNYGSLNTNLASLLLRLIFGGLFIYHGYGKIVNFDQYSAMFPDYTGLGPKISFMLVIFAEFFCGIFVTIGFLTRLSVVPIFITMMVAFFIAHAKDAFQIKELAFIFWLLSFVIFILGSGKYSLDRVFFQDNQR